MTRNKKTVGRLPLLGCTFLWGTSFVVLKNALDDMPTLWILAIRFTGAALLMALFGLKKLRMLDRGYWKGGALMGVFLAVAYIFQTFGLVYTTPGKNAFLTSLSDRVAVLRAGEYIGDMITICCGLFYALHIIATSTAAEGRDPVLLSMVQFLVAAVICWILAPFSSPFPASVPSSTWLSIAYLCVMCTGVCFLLQTIGQKYTPPNEVAIFLTLESVFGAAISVLFFHEKLTLQVFCGFVLIFLAVLISETKPAIFRKK